MQLKEVFASQKYCCIKLLKIYHALSMVCFLLLYYIYIILFAYTKMYYLSA